MANIRKPFNFRNGVQVDDEKLIVSPTGLVGIGTTIPTESLDVRGDAKIVGFATFNSASTPSLIAVDSTLTTVNLVESIICLLYTSPSPRDVEESRMPSSA